MIQKKYIIAVVMMLCSVVMGWATEYKANLSETSSVSGNQATGNFALNAKLLTGLPFELSFDVATTGSSYNQWGSCLFATGTNALANTYPDGFQLYLRSATNGGYLVLKIGSSETRFDNIRYNEPFSLNISFNGKNKLIVTATNTSTSSAVTKEFTVSNINISNFCYALPSGLNISNLSIACDALEIQNLARTKYDELQGNQGQVGFPTEAECEKLLAEVSSDADALKLYEYYLRFIAWDAETVLPQLGQVYYIFNVVRTNPAVATYLKTDGTTFGLSNTLPTEGDPQMFQYMWVPRVGSTENKMYFMSTSGTKKRLAWDGISVAGTEWNIEQGLSYGFLSLKNSTYAAAYTNCTGFAGWGSKGCYASKKQQYPNTTTWSTDFMMRKAPYVALDLSISGLTGGESATVDFRFNGDVHVEGLTDGDVVVVHEDNLSALTASMFTPSDVDGKTPVVTIENGKVLVLYTSFTNLYDAARQELTDAQSRITNLLAGSLYTQEAVTAANSAIAAAKTKYDDAGSAAERIKEAMDDVTNAMETFFKTIDGKYVTICKSNKYITTTSATGVSLTTASPATLDKYFGLYRLYYIGNGEYQLENAYRGNWLGQTTGANNLGSCASSTAPKWRGNYRFVVGAASAAEGYDLVNDNGVSEYQHLGIDGSNVTRARAQVLWDVRLANVDTYTTAYINTAKFADGTGTVDTKTPGYSGVIGKSTAYDVTKALEDAKISAAGNEHQLVAATNTFINSKSAINLPEDGDYVVFTNVGKSGYTLGENHYEMKSTNAAVDLGKVWKVVKENTIVNYQPVTRYYLKNAKTGLYLGTIEKSTQGRLGEHCKQPYDIVSADHENGYIALHDKGTNTAYSYIHIDSYDKTVGWSYAGSNASQWTVTTVTDENLKKYTSAAFDALKTKFTATKNMAQPGDGTYYKKSAADITSAETALSVTIDGGDDGEQAYGKYLDLLAAYNKFNAAGATAIANNDVVLIRTRKMFDISSTDYNLYVNAVLNDGAPSAGSMSNGEATNGDSQYFFSAWQLQQEGDYYRLMNFFTGQYLSKQVSESSQAAGRMGLTDEKDEAALFLIENHDGWYVTLHRADYDERNNGYMHLSDFKNNGYKIRFGMVNGTLYASSETESACQYELLKVGSAQYKKCMQQLLEYRPLLGDGIGKYTDTTGDYITMTEPYKNYTKATDWEALSDDDVIEAAKKIGPTLAHVQINLPTNKHFYRMYSLGEGDLFDNEGHIVDNKTSRRHYIAAPETVGTRQYMNMVQTSNDSPALTDVQKLSTVFYFDGEHLLNYSTGLLVGSTSTPWAEGAIGEMFKFKFNNTGYTSKGCYSIKPQGRSYLYNNTSKNATSGSLNGWGTAYDARCEWYLEELTSLPVSITSVGYATLCSPVALKVPDGVTAYVADNVTSTAITLVSVKAGQYANEAVIPANTPVLIKGDAGIHEFPLSDELNDDTYEYNAAEYAEKAAQYVKSQTFYPYNKFYGSVPTVLNLDDKGNAANDTDNEKYYTLQSIGGKLGFYRYTGAERKPFKAYYRAKDISDSAPAQAAKGFLLDFEDEADGMDRIVEVGKGVDAIFDIAGRKVIQMNAGNVYIIGGKKYRKQ